uniref:Uncharacterized protein n=1 Tax=Oryza meridionalis TaxID=40149 RepID=A0A0E0FAR9_9ORYZ
MVARWGAVVGQWGRWSRSGNVFSVDASPDGSAKGAGSGGSSSSLSVSTLTLSGASSLLCGEFLDWIEAAAYQRGKLRLLKQCHSIQILLWPDLARRPAGGGTEGSWASSQGWWFDEVGRQRGVGRV